MSLLLDRNIPGPKTHALVIGVGAYPHAKAGKGVDEKLRNVPDLPSAADSAKVVCDWLLQNQDRLAAPLATLEVLISDPADPNNRYPWAAGPVDAADENNVRTKGKDWYARVVEAPGNTAFFYCCGHGASYQHNPVLFLEDLNQSRANAWAHINLGSLAFSLRKDPQVAAAFLFADACGQYIPDLELQVAQDTRFFDAPNPFANAGNKVSLLCAAAEGQLAYEGADRTNDKLMLGRFTQAVLQGLNGSSARQIGSKWGVSSRDLLDDLKALRRVFFGHWKDEQPFEPYPAVTANERLPIVFPVGFELPLVVMVEPAEKMSLYNLFISQQDKPATWLKNRPAGSTDAWMTTVPPGNNGLWAIAENAAGCYPQLFMPIQPLFDQRVVVQR
jgi:hypothetical protein